MFFFLLTFNLVPLDGGGGGGVQYRKHWEQSRDQPAYTSAPIWIDVKKNDGVAQERRQSSALAMELRVSCTNPSRRCPNLLQRRKVPHFMVGSFISGNQHDLVHFSVTLMNHKLDFFPFLV